MTIDATTEQKLNNWFNARGGLPQCPGCSRRSWTASDLVYRGVYTKGQVTLGGPTVVEVPLVCTFCAYTLNYNASVMKLVS